MGRMISKNKRQETVQCNDTAALTFWVNIGDIEADVQEKVTGQSDVMNLHSVRRHLAHLFLLESIDIGKLVR